MGNADTIDESIKFKIIAFVVNVGMSVVINYIHIQIQERGFSSKYKLYSTKLLWIDFLKIRVFGVQYSTLSAVQISWDYCSPHLTRFVASYKALGLGKHI